MTGRRLAARSLRFYWRSHLGVLLGATLGAAILVGALAVGDSVRYSLREMALVRLGGVHLALNGQSRFFRAELADRLAEDLQAPVAPVILLRGTVTFSAPDGGGEERRVGRVQVIGVEDRFWDLGPSGGTSRSGTPVIRTDSALLNTYLAEKLGVKVGDEVLLRVDRPSLLSRDAPLSTVEDATVTLRLPVGAVVGDAEFGRFSLEANQVPSLNAFVPLSLLQRQIGMRGRTNVLLVGAPPSPPSSREKGEARRLTPEAATQALWKHWAFADAGMQLRELPQQRALELRTDRVFLDPPIGQAAVTAVPGAQGILTYFVNELRIGNRTTPYSVVSALQGAPIPPDMKNSEVILNRWLAEDLGAKPGDTLIMKYWVSGPMRRLEERTSAFRVRAIVPIEGAAADRELMPNIPGLADKKDCREWEPGVPIDLEKIRDKDQAYWSKYRGTPKAFLTLRAGQEIWNNRFGNLTAVRYPMGRQTRAAVEACIRQALNPASLGLFFAPIREQALAASAQSMDFGQLFLGFSLFLIAASLLLTALLFALGVEQRAEEVGTLLALGWTPQRVQRLLLLEGGALALAAALVGTGLAVLYTKVVILGLSTVWRGAVAHSTLQYHAASATLAVGALVGFLVALCSIGLVTRRQARAPARQLLAGEGVIRCAQAGLAQSRASGIREGEVRALKALRLSPILAAASMTAALALAVAALTVGDEQATGFFFGAGTLLLIGGIAACRVLMVRIEGGAAARRLTIRSLGARNSARRWGRSLSAIGLLACGSFMVVAVGANRHDPTQGADRRSSGTGGFAYYGESTLPIYQDLNTREGQEAYGLEPEELAGVAFVAMRRRDGDEASCLNLNRAQVPSLLGVQPDELRKRGAFTFVKTLPYAEALRDNAPERERAERSVLTSSPWDLLNRADQDGTIPVIGDVNTVLWSLGKRVGDTLPYVDDRGRTVRLRIVGMLTNSVLQGHLVMSESNFIALFPSHSGYQVFLIDTPRPLSDSLSHTLTRALSDVGFSLTPAAERLAAFSTVENTYLSIFALLGGLGLLLGSVGLGVVVLRNVLERRSELAILRAVGFRKGALHQLVFSEHALLLLLGLAVGVVASLVAVLPALRSPGAGVPTLSLSVTLLAVLISGLVWTWGATTLAIRGPLLNALRNE